MVFVEKQAGTSTQVLPMLAILAMLAMLAMRDDAIAPPLCVCAVLNGEERREAVAERVNRLGAGCRSERDGRRAVIRETDGRRSCPDAGGEDGRDAGSDDYRDGRVHS